MIFKKFDTFQKFSLLENNLKKFSKSIDDLKKEYKNHKILDISSNIIKYNKNTRTFEIKERDFKDWNKYEYVLLVNSKTNMGIAVEKGGQLISRKKDEYIAKIYSGSVNVGIPAFLSHSLYILYNNPIPLSHEERMRSGYYGRLD